MYVQDSEKPSEVMYDTVLMADYSSVDSFHDSADRGTVINTIGGVAWGAAYGYVLDKTMHPALENANYDQKTYR